MLFDMANGAYSVSVVVDREYGPDIRELLENGPVWVVDSPSNRDWAQRLWTEFPDRNHLDGITVFKSGEDQSPEQMFIGQIGTIDLHHGEYSADPAYTVIRVFGCKLTADVRDAAAKYGFEDFNDLAEGFEATRPLPPPLIS